MSAQAAAKSSPQSVKETPWGESAAQVDAMGGAAFTDLFKKASWALLLRVLLDCCWAGEGLDENRRCQH